jgi:sarcosine oxidase subunit alpha
MSGGWTPSLHLWSHSKGTIKWNKDLSAYIPDKAHENVCCIGSCNGNFGIAKHLMKEIRSLKIAKSILLKSNHLERVLFPSNIPSYVSKEKQKAFVDFQNDVTEKDISLAVQEGFKSIEHVKRYTTNGMATDQGKTF